MRNIWCAILITSFLRLEAQEILSLSGAISIAMEENFGIKVVKLQERASELQIYKANVGMTPNVDLNANLGLSGNNVNQTFTDGRVINRWGRTVSPGVNVSADMILYDGGQMQAAFDRLGLLNELTVLQSKVLIQNTIVEVMRAYYDIDRIKETVNYLNILIGYLNERLKITEERWIVGQGSKLDFLQSKTDLNAQLVDLKRAENELKNAKVRLNGLLNRDPSIDFDTQSDQYEIRDYALDELFEVALVENRDLIVLQKSVEINKKEEEQRQAAMNPTLAANGSLGYSYLNTTAGFLLSNRNIFTSLGVTGRMPIYDGSNRKKQIEIAKLNTQIAETQQENVQIRIQNDLAIAFNQYMTDRELLTFEEENRLVVEENLIISIEKFRLGGSTILELNEAQRSYDTSLNRLVNAKFSVKLSELELLRLSGLIAR